VAIVDPYSSAHGLAPAFLAADIRPVAIQTAFVLPPTALSTWEPANFDHVLDGTGGLESLVSELRALNPVRILPGAESGIELADALTERLLPGTGNVPALGAARRDKWETARALADAGVPRLEQLCTADAAEAERWLVERGLAGAPLVLKPPRSAGADAVHVVRPGHDWRGVFASLLGDVNKMGVRNDGVLIQEFAEGVEYAVDTYSADGVHTLVLVCRYRKRAVGDRLGVYEAVEFLPADAPEIAKLFGYVRQVLDAVGLTSGSAHVEVMATPRGLRLIEVNSRLAGGRQQELTRLATGDSQIDRHVRHIVDGHPGPDVYTLRRHVTVAYLSAPRPGVWRNAEELSAAEKLATFHSAHLVFGTGDEVPQTLDVFSALGQIVLAGDTADAVAADLAVVRRIEARFQIG
jgi:biotin carboxylase